MLVNVKHLLVSQVKCSPTNDIVNRVYLIHYDKVRVLMLVRYRINDLLEHSIVHLVMPPLLQHEILYSTAKFEQVLYDVLFLTTVFSRVRLNH